MSERIEGGSPYCHIHAITRPEGRGKSKYNVDIAQPKSENLSPNIAGKDDDEKICLCGVRIDFPLPVFSYARSWTRLGPTIHTVVLYLSTSRITHNL